MKKKITAIILMVVLVLALALPMAPVGADPGWLAGWDKRVKLTIDKGDIGTALSDFPILVYLSTSSGTESDDVSFVFDELGIDANRKKIAVTESDGTTELYVEIEKWDDVNEKAWLWVKVPSIASDADTELYLYYDSSHADNPNVGDPNSAAAEAVWDANFKLVDHMRDGADNANTRDSTSFDNDGAKTEANAPAVTTDVNGKISEAQDFDGDDDRVNLGNAASLDFADGDFTVELWFYATSWTEPEQRFVWYGDTKADTGNKKWWGLHGLVTANKLLFTVDDNITKRDAEIAPLPAEGAWHHLVGVRNSGGTNYLYLDGGVPGSVVDNGNSITQTTYKDTYIGVGRSDGFLRYFDGLIDEVRISGTARSAAWIKASYESERDDLLAFGSEELAAVIEKELLEGPEEIGIKQPVATPYKFEITYSNLDPATPVRIIDTVPAEFEIFLLDESAGDAIFFDTNKGKGKGNSANRIEWDLPSGTTSATLTVYIRTVESPGKGHKDTVYKPTSTGPLFLNDGATAFEVDEEGNLVLVEVVDPDTGEITFEPVVIVGPSNALVVQAV